MNNKLQLTNHKRQETRDESPIGSVLILTVVLTSLLAIIGVMFIMITRVDRMATSAISENKELNFAAETVVALLSQELVLDVPGVAGAEYYDYPGDGDKWLASLEPYKDGTDYKWRQISDVTGYISNKVQSGDWLPTAWHNVPVEPTGLTATTYVPEYPDIHVNASGEFLDPNGNPARQGVSADADGDGVADSKWVKLDDITSDKGKPIYAAIRIVDNGGMLNVNTAYKFDPNEGREKIDGSRQTQINLFALAQRSTSNNIGQLDTERYGDETHNLNNYIRDVVWRYNEPNGRYTPFDVSDELELRNRFLVNHPDIDTRIEEVWNDAFRGIHDVDTPVHTGGAINIDGWFDRSQYDLSDPNANDNYSYRHIASIYNMDRIIDPNGRKMLNINDANVSAVYNTIIDANLNIANPKAVAAQIAVNLVDFRDNDSNVSAIDVNSVKYFGFERPCVYISEMAHRFVEPNTIPGLPLPGSLVYRSYAIELHKPYTDDNYPEPNQWRLSIEGCPNSPFTVNWSGTQHFHVMLFEQPNAPLSVAFDLTDKDPNFSPQAEKTQTLQPGTVIFAPRRTISLERRLGTNWISVDSVTAKDNLPSKRVWDPDGQVHSYQRDITLHKCIRRLWDDSFSKEASATLGDRNVYENGDLIYIQAHPYLDPLIYPKSGFTNIGEIGMVFRKSAYSQGPYPIGPSDTETTARLNLADPCYQNLFQRLTVFDPSMDGINNDGDRRADNSEIIDEDELNLTPEWKVPGRININTAPWFVLAQLPWVSQRIGGTDYSLAQAIVKYRDESKTPKGFKSIGELMNVAGMDYYNKTQIGDLLNFPDLTPKDGAPDDFEERDVIFARISNLVTVRSDVFTAYILVRIGADGPQKRVMAILDRSNVYSGGDKVRIIALHPVPDPR
jgi:hypothetical protein